VRVTAAGRALGLGNIDPSPASTETSKTRLRHCAASSPRRDRADAANIHVLNAWLDAAAHGFSTPRRRSKWPALTSRSRARRAGARYLGGA